MSLPAAFMDELKSRLSLAQVVGRKVIWDNRKSNPGKGDMWAPCPFHQEKSASFHVDDKKGFYYCFGCQAKGDAFTFVRDTENVSFIEAVAILAREVGLPVPESDPRAQEVADRKTRLIAVMEQAVNHYRLQLRSGAGAAARAYLARRGLSEAAQDRWQIGFAPEGWHGLCEALGAKGVDADLLLEAGLAKRRESGGQIYDLFRGRIMFPIRDLRGRAIAFGGRAMDPGENAKYLNSPVTPLFDKGRILFNLGPAREAVGRGKPLIVAEGYMDVIALSEAGFAGAVAPLGTAVTADQLAMLWRIADEPLIALDGDKAGLAAALRVVDLALPLLEAGKSLRFALLPQDMDPDDLIRAQGPQAMQAVLDGARPMLDLLWQRQTEGLSFDSPERKAGLEKTQRAETARIRDTAIRAHYDEALRRMRRDLFGQGRDAAPAAGARRITPGKGDWRKPREVMAVPVQSTRLSPLASDMGDPDILREAVILAVLIKTPAILPEFEAELERMDCLLPAHARLRDTMLRLGPADLDGRLRAELGPAALENLFGARHVAIVPAVRNPGDPEAARMCLAEELAKIRARRGHAREVAEAETDAAGLADEGLTWRLQQAAAALHRAGRGDTEDKTAYEIAPNGLSISRQERQSAAAERDQIDFAKAGRRRHD